MVVLAWWYTESVFWMLFWTRCLIYVCPGMGSSENSFQHFSFSSFFSEQCISEDMWQSPTTFLRDYSMAWIMQLGESPCWKSQCKDGNCRFGDELRIENQTLTSFIHAVSTTVINILSPALCRNMHIEREREKLSWNIRYTKSTYGNNKPVLPMQTPLKKPPTTNHTPLPPSCLSHCWVKNILNHFIIYFL